MTPAGHSTIFSLRFAGVAQLVEHFLAKEDVASSSLVTRSLFTLMDRYLLIVLPVAATIFLSGCGRKSPEAETSQPAPEPTGPEVVEFVEAGEQDGAAPSAVMIESSAEPMSPESVPGRYRDPSAPEVAYEFGTDNTWSATWQPSDESRGLMMNGVYQVEDGGVVHLRVLEFGRREPFLGDDWDKRTPPHPRPRGYFRIEGNEMIMMSDRTSQAFTMAPFNAVRLVKTGD